MGKFYISALMDLKTKTALTIGLILKTKTALITSHNQLNYKTNKAL
jgi:hypothetical protein